MPQADGRYTDECVITGLMLYETIPFLILSSLSHAYSCFILLLCCSAGVGRTGTFIVIDRLLQQIQREDNIDVFGTILEMREYRCNMIQTEVRKVVQMILIFLIVMSIAD